MPKQIKTAQSTDYLPSPIDELRFHVIDLREQTLPAFSCFCLACVAVVVFVGGLAGKPGQAGPKRVAKPRGKWGESDEVPRGEAAR